jgi:hypothetical protein
MEIGIVSAVMCAVILIVLLAKGILFPALLIVGALYVFLTIARTGR